MRFVLFALLAGCNGRVDSTGAATDAADGATEDGGCFIGPADECGPADRIKAFYRVDMSRRCIDYDAGRQIEMCACLKTAVDCWIDPRTNAIFYSGCTPNLLPGYCRCGPSLESDVSAFPHCP